MSARKRFFFDYDGTLATPDGIPCSTVEAVRALQAAGHSVSLCTGRLQCNAMELMSASPFDMTAVVADGGNSATVDGRLLWMDPLPIEPLRDFLRRIDRAGVPWAVTTANEMVRYARSEEFLRRAPAYYMPTEVVPGLDIESLSCVYKAYVPCDLEQEALLDFSGVPHVRYFSDMTFVEPMAKGLGIKRLMDWWGVPCEDAVVFGDGRNDLSMFLPDWTCVAMGNACAELKRRADFVTRDVGDHGILRACERFGWL